MLPVATSTLETFLTDTYETGFETILWVLGYIWPFLIATAVLFIFWRVGRSFFRG